MTDQNINPQELLEKIRAIQQAYQKRLDELEAKMENKHAELQQKIENVERRLAALEQQRSIHDKPYIVSKMVIRLDE